MKHSKTITEYSTLLKNLNTTGLYQLRLYSICIIFWTMAGVYKSLFDHGFESFECPYGLGLFEGLGIVVFSYLGLVKGRKFSTICAGIVSFIGFLMTLISFLIGESSILATLGIALIGACMYSQPCMLLCIVCEMTSLRIIEIILLFSLLMSSLGRIIILPVIEELVSWNGDKGLILCIILPLCLIGLVMSIFTEESLRYYFENDINQAEFMVERIKKFNSRFSNKARIRKRRGTVVLQGMQVDENFVLGRIHIRKYNYLTLLKYNSLDFHQYCLGVLMFLLGVTGREANYIFSMKDTMVDDFIETIWISGFQIIGIFASMFFIRFSNRRTVCIALSCLISVLSTILFFFYSSSLILDFTLIGLSAVFSIFLYSFFIINAIEFYPHSVRPLGIAVMLSLYYIGQVVFYIYLLVKPESKVVIELFILASWMMFGHCWGMKETIDDGLAYDLKEIEEEEDEEM